MLIKHDLGRVKSLPPNFHQLQHLLHQVLGIRQPFHNLIPTCFFQPDLFGFAWFYLFCFVFLFMNLPSRMPGYSPVFEYIDYIKYYRKRAEKCLAYNSIQQMLVFGYETIYNSPLTISRSSLFPKVSFHLSLCYRARFSSCHLFQEAFSVSAAHHLSTSLDYQPIRSAYMSVSLIRRFPEGQSHIYILYIYMYNIYILYI